MAIGAGKKFAMIALVVVIGGAALWTWTSLSWSYSEGERAGVLQKFSRKGWICKTYEGELAQYLVAGISPQIWQFSTRDPKLAQELTQAVGQKMRLKYDEHRGVPTSCFADTPYFATGFTIVKDGAP